MVTRISKHDVRPPVVDSVTPRLRGERMSKVDTAWLRMDGEANLMMITGVWLLQPSVDYETLCQRVQERLLKFRRFGQRVIEDASGATWVDDEAFDIKRHVVREKLKFRSPGKEQDALLNLFGRKTTAVMTNVPGPGAKMALCGASVDQLLFWVPQSGDVGLGVSILSYAGGVQFGVITDSTLCPDPKRIIDKFEPEFAKLPLITLMLPWG